MDVAPPAGTRFELNLDANEEEQEYECKDSIAPIPSAFSFIKDVLECQPERIPPSAPVLSDSSALGFPVHAKRKRQSAFRQRIQQQQQGRGGVKATLSASFQKTGYIDGEKNKTTEIQSEKDLIDEENKRRLDHMSPEQIEKERKELFSELSPELLQMFLKKASLDDIVETSRPQKKTSTPPIPHIQPLQPTVSEDTEADDASTRVLTTIEKNAAKSVTFASSPLSGAPHIGDIPLESLPPVINVHFPQARQQDGKSDDLDPSSPQFLTRLHQKYFSSLPADPSKLAWMQPPTESAEDPYSPALPSFLPSALRFDFHGTLLPPRLAREIPAHLGLHHHGDAPLSAGYTIPELSHLARSAFSAQRCMAIQTLGRIMYKLGIGKYSGRRKNVDAPGNEDIGRGLWRCLHEGRVVDGLQDAATGGVNGRGDPHLSVRSYAVEALWLWQKGGGESWKSD